MLRFSLFTTDEISCRSAMPTIFNEAAFVTGVVWTFPLSAGASFFARLFIV